MKILIRKTEKWSGKNIFKKIRNCLDKLLIDQEKRLAGLLYLIIKYSTITQ